MSVAKDASSSQGSSSASFLELFFDLVFVYAFAQLTGFLADNLTLLGLLQDAALLAVLWWAWVTYSWLTNAVPAEDAIPARLIILSAMAAMLEVTLAIPDAFGEHALLFGVAYFVVRLLQVSLFALATEGDNAARDPQTRALLSGRTGVARAGGISGRLGASRARGKNPVKPRTRSLIKRVIRELNTPSGARHPSLERRENRIISDSGL